MPAMKVTIRWQEF